MFYDLVPEESMSPLVGILYSTVTDAYVRLRRLVSDLTDEEFHYKGPTETLNSPAQLVRHLALIDLRWAYRFRGQPIPDHLLAKYGPFRDAAGRLPDVESMSLTQALADYDWVLAELRATCQSMPNSDLTRVVGVDGGGQATFRWGLWHMADHSRYHQGHIAWLKAWSRA